MENKRKPPSKYWFISVDKLFYTNDRKQFLSPDKKQAFRYFDEEKAKEVFNELFKRYSVVQSVVTLNVVEDVHPVVEKTDNGVKKVVKKHRTIKSGEKK